MMKAETLGCGNGTGGVTPGAAKLLQEAQELEPWLQEIFFRLHRNPELGTQEFQTQALILEELEKMGIEAKPIADTGVLGIIRGGKSGKTVAFRADMDALPVQEDTGLPYASQVPGVMHACGHDVHVAVLLGAAKLLAAGREIMQGNVKLFFQPAEEGIGGANRMIRAGCMENPKVDAVFFGHSSGSYPVGSVSIKAGPVSAASNPFAVTFRGKGAHGAAPHQGVDAILAASQAVVALQSISSRRTDPVDAAVISVGTFHAGTAPNVLPETARIQGIIRTLTPETRERTVASFRQVVGGIAAAMDVQAQIEIREGYASVSNDPEMTRRVGDAAAALFGSDAVHVQAAPSLGTEDVGYFFRHAPGCYYHIGVGHTQALHSPHFAADPAALKYGAALYVRIARDYLEGA